MALGKLNLMLARGAFAMRVGLKSLWFDGLHHESGLVL